MTVGPLPRTAQIAALLIGAMLTIPFLLPFAQPPIASFYQEWLTMALGAAAFVLLATGAARISVPFVCLLPLMLIALLGVHTVTGRLAFSEQGVIAGLYLVWTGVMVMAGQLLRQSLGGERLVILFAWVIGAGALASALIAGLQMAGWTPAGWPTLDPHGRVQGNLNQPNHLADYLAIGIASTIFLAATRRLRAGAAALALALMLPALWFSGSRAAVFYLGLLLIGSLWLRARIASPEFGRAAIWMTAIALTFVMLAWLGPMTTDSSAHGASAIDSRFGLEDAGLDLRLRKWHAALLMAEKSPVLGVGFGAYGWHYFLLAPRLPAEVEGLATDHAHNLLLHLLAEFGVFAALACAVVALVWLHAQRRAGASPAAAWLWAATGIVLLHSGLEHPLWFAYFLGLFSLLVGASWPENWSLGALRGGLTTAGVAGLVALGLLWLVMSDYRQLERLARPVEGESPAALQARVVDAYQRTLFPHLLVFALASGATVDDEQLEAKIALNATALRVLPTPEAAYRHAVLLALAGRTDAARRAWDRASAAYPRAVPAAVRALDSDARAPIALLLEYARSKIGTRD
mgnify:FL=1